MMTNLISSYCQSNIVISHGITILKILVRVESTRVIGLSQKIGLVVREVEGMQKIDQVIMREMEVTILRRHSGWDLVSLNIQMDQSIVDKLIMGNSMVLVVWSTLMEIFTKVIGKMGKHMEMVFSVMYVVDFMMGNGKMTNKKEKAQKHGTMVPSDMKATSDKAKRQAGVNSNSKVVHIKVISLMVSSTDTANTTLLSLEKSIMENSQIIN